MSHKVNGQNGTSGYFEATYLNYGAQNLFGNEKAQLTYLNIRFNKATVDFLKANEGYKISDFKNLKVVKITDEIIINSDYQGYPSGAMSKISEADIAVFQNWLDGIDQLDSLVQLSTPSFFEIKPIKNLNTLNIFHYHFIHPSFYKNHSRIKELTLISDTKNLQSVGFDFSTFNALERLSLIFFSDELRTIDLPNLSQCNDLKTTTVSFLKTDSITFTGQIFGAGLVVYADSLKQLAFSNVIAVDTLRYFELGAPKLNTFDLTGLTSNSNDFHGNFYLNSLQSFDFKKLPTNTAYTELFIVGDFLREVQFPKETMIVHNLRVESDALKVLPSGIVNLKNLKAVSLFTPQINSISMELFALKELEYLNINSSDLETIPLGIEQLQNCVKLTVNVNNLKRADMKRLSKMKNLNEVYLYQTELNAKSKSKRMKLKEAYLRKKIPNATVNVFTYPKQ